MHKKLVAAGLLTLGGIVWTAPALADPGRGANILCYVWANNASPAIGVPYIPSATYSYNTVGRAAANTVTRTGVGVYTVTCKGVGGGSLFAGSGTWGAGGHVQVTAYGSNANHCKVNSWGTGAPNFTASVSCYNPAGTRADTLFDLLFVW